MSEEIKGWSIAVDGDAISAMPEEKRYSTIVEPSPSYRKDEQAEGNVQNHKIKLIVSVVLSDGRKADYYMNRTSARKVASLLKTDLSEEGMKQWVGAKIVWGKILDQMIGQTQRKVLYVTEASKQAAETTSVDSQPTSEKVA